MISSRRVGETELIKHVEGSALPKRYFIFLRLRTEKRKGVVIDVL